MLSELQLKEKLQSLARNKFQPTENDDLSELIPAMLTYIGSTDSDLRDELIYSAFGTWILHDKRLSQEQLHQLMSTVLDERHMFYGLGEQDTDSVFTRSFSILLLPLLLIVHRAQPFMSVAEINEIKEKLLDYLAREKDLRGFVGEKGWAHAVAHSADALDDLVQCVEMDHADLAAILVTIRDVVCVTRVGYTHLEDERLVTPVIALLNRQMLPDALITAWIESFAGRVQLIQASPERLIIRSNVKNFLQSLYFRLQREPLANKFESPIERTLQKINPYKKAVAE
jgi:hypothetical protein